MAERQPYKLRQGTLNIEREIAPLIEKEFPEYETFFNKHLLPLIKNGHWRPDTIEYLEFIGMANFGVLKSINFIHRNISHIKRRDPDQRFKNIYFHFGMVADSVDSLARNIALTSDHLGLIKIDTNPKDHEVLKKSFEKWLLKRYDKGLSDLKTSGKQLVFHPHTVDFLSYTISEAARGNYKTFIASLKEYRNFFTHNPGVDIIQMGLGDLFVVKREKITEARSWSNLKAMIEKSSEMFVDPKEQANKDLEGLLRHLRILWAEFGVRMDQIEQHENYGTIFQNFNRAD